MRDDNDKFIDTDEHKDNVSPSVDLIPLARAANSLRGWQLSSYKGPSISTRSDDGHDGDDTRDQQYQRGQIMVMVIIMIQGTVNINVVK